MNASLEALAAALSEEGVTFLASDGTLGSGMRLGAGIPWSAALRGARAALGMSMLELAGESEVSPRTLLRLEDGRRVFPNTLRRVLEALQVRGILFISPDGSLGPGFRMPLAALARKDLRF